MFFKHLWYLQLVISEGSFAKAACVAQVSQPAISLAMQALEQALGLPLFEKIGRQKLPTKTALEVAKRTADLQGRLTVLGQHQVSARDLLMVKSAPTLRMGLAPAAALLYGPVIEKTWRSLEPDGLLRIESNSAPEILLDLKQGDLDLAIVPRPRRYDASGINCHVLHVSTPTIYAREGNPFNHATSLMEIKEATWAAAGRFGTSGNVIEEAHRVRKLPPPRVLVQCADYLTLIKMVACTDFLCVIPNAALLPQHPAAAIIPVKIQEGLPQYEVCLFWRPTSNHISQLSLNSIVSALGASA